MLKVKLLTKSAKVPFYAHSDDSGLDLFADLAEPVRIRSWQYKTIPTGIVIELPPFTEAQIRSRSGLAAKNGIFVLNSPGTIDEGYRGEIKVVLFNSSGRDFLVKHGMKIAQMVIAPVIRPTIKVVSKLSATSRGSNGFGSTGIY